MARSGSSWPSGLPYIFVNEAAERYSFYGMRGILTVFMTSFLVNRSGEMDIMTGTEARIWYHSFVMGVYFLPILGALLSDIFWGKYRTIIGLSIVYCLGHLVLAVDQTRLGLGVGLGLIAFGAGGIKPCVSAHLGDQFDQDSQVLIDKAYAWFYFMINVGSAVALLAGEFLLQRFGPHVAFGLPGLLMLIATIVFWIGRRKYIAMPAVGWSAYKRDLSSPEGWRAVLRMIPVFLLVAVFWSLYDQTGSSWIQQASSDLMDKNLMVFGRSVSILPSQVQFVNPVLILTFVPLFTMVIYPAVERLGIRLTALRKIGFGMFLAAASFAIIASMEAQIFVGESVHVRGQMWATVVLTAAEVLISMTCLEFAYTQAPNSMKSLIMGLYFLSLSLGNFIAVEVNQWMRQDVEIASVEGGDQARFELTSSVDLVNGRKFMLEGESGLLRVITTEEGRSDTIPMQGTYIMGKVERETLGFDLLDANSREPVRTIGVFDPDSDHEVYVNKLKGAEYFWFFTAFMFVAGLLFIPVAIWFRGKTYVQDHALAEDLG